MSEQNKEGPSFVKRVEEAVNKSNREAASNTPDFILAEFVDGAMKAAERLIKSRDRWYGLDPRPGQSSRERFFTMQLGEFRAIMTSMSQEQMGYVRDGVAFKMPVGMVRVVGFDEVTGEYTMEFLGNHLAEANKPYFIPEEGWRPLPYQAARDWAGDGPEAIKNLSLTEKAIGLAITDHNSKTWTIVADDPNNMRFWIKR